MLYGTTLEKNGFYNVFNGTDDEKVAIYAGKNTKINLFGCYSESQNTTAKNGGQVTFFGSHQHSNAKAWAMDGSVDDFQGYGKKVNKLLIIDRYATFLLSSSATISSISTNSKKAKVTSSSSNSNVLIYSRTISAQGLLGKQLSCCKLGFSFKFLSGFQANPNLIIKPVLRILSLTANSSDSNRDNFEYPMSLLSQQYEEEHYFEFFWRPRNTGLPYLDPNSELNNIQIQFHIQNKDGTYCNFSSNNLELHIDNISLILFSDKEIFLTSGLRKSGADQDRPSNLSNFEAGESYLNTNTESYELWSGTKWISIAKQSEIKPADITQAQLSSITEAVNINNKYRGRLAYNSTNGKMYFALGSTPVSAWRSTDNSGDITPT